jgi:biotin carboxyl carrier protein
MSQHYLVTVEDREFDIVVEYDGKGYRVTVDGREHAVQRFDMESVHSLMLLDNLSYEAYVRSNGYEGRRSVFMLGREIEAQIEDYHLAQLKKAAGMSAGGAVDTTVRAPMPGLVLQVKVAPGDSVQKGQALCIVEAMKMENVIKAPADGAVKAVPATVGSSVEKGDVLVDIEPA